MVTLIQRSIDREPNVTPRRLFGDGFKTAAFFEVMKSQGLGPGSGLRWAKWHVCGLARSTDARID